LAAAHRPKLPLLEREQIATVELDRAAADVHAWRQQPENRARGHALPRAALPDDADARADGDDEIDAVQERDVVAVGSSGDAQPADLEERPCADAGDPVIGRMDHQL